MKDKVHILEIEEVEGDMVRKLRSKLFLDDEKNN
jgi:hypothetical protein